MRPIAVSPSKGPMWKNQDLYLCGAYVYGMNELMDSQVSAVKPGVGGCLKLARPCGSLLFHPREPWVCMFWMEGVVGWAELA